MSCPKNKILNTLTNRCILKKNSVQFNKHIKQKLLLKCIHNKYRSPITARCIYKSKTSNKKTAKRSNKKSKVTKKKSTKRSKVSKKKSKKKSTKRYKVSKKKSAKVSKKKSAKAKRSKTKSTKKSPKRSKVSKTKSTKKSPKISKVSKTKSTKKSTKKSAKRSKVSNKLDKTKYYGYITPTSGKLRHEINISQGFDISETIRTDFNYWTLQTISNTFFVTLPLAKRLTNDSIRNNKEPERIHYSPAQNAKLKTYISIKKALPIIQLIDTDYDYWTMSKLCIKFNISFGLAFILRIECFNMQYDRKKLNK